MARCNTTTPLAQFAKSLRPEKALELGMEFPMYVVSLQNVLKMTEVRPHQELLEDGIIQKMEGGKAMLISHQWTSNHHPDPDAKQLKAFQGAMRNLLNGSIAPHFSAWSELLSLYLGRPRFAMSDLSETAYFVWYDYFSIPQYAITDQSRSVSQNSYENQRKAIQSIPAYVNRCELFVVLCPPMKHGSTLSDLSYHSWAERGWCRTEAMARELSVKNGSILIIEGPKQVSVSGTLQTHFLAPGEGEFTVDSDRKVVGKFLTEMLHNKLHGLLKKGDFPGYRLLLNQQLVWLRQCETKPVAALLDAETDGRSGVDGIAEEFLLQHGFSKVSEYDKAGWSPLCYAALGGHSKVLEALLMKKADPNEVVRKKCPEAGLGKGQSALAICVQNGNNEAMRVLLRAQADPNKADSMQETPLMKSGIVYDNVEGVRLLLEARADATLADVTGTNAFHVACVWGASAVAKELFAIPGATKTIQKPLFGAIVSGRGSADHISMLLDMGYDISEQFDHSDGAAAVRLFFCILSLKHSLWAKKTPLNTFAYHYPGATPVMASLLAGNYAIASCLIEKRARLDLCNSRNQTAFDLAVKLSAPDALLWELWRSGAGDHASQASISWWCTQTLGHGEERMSTVSEVLQDQGDPDPMVSVPF